MTLDTHLSRLREIMAAFPPLAAHTTSTDIDPNEIYFPRSHAAALDPNRSLVIGNRGMGKSFWANALTQDKSKDRISDALPESRLGGNTTHAYFGFSGAEGVKGISRDELTFYLKKGFSPELIWRIVTLAEIARIAQYEPPTDTLSKLQWAENNPGAMREILRSADNMLSKKSERIVFVFDQLEQLSDNLEQRRNLTQGILRLALSYKSYRCLHVKIFMRPDQRADEKLFNFPDASKISGEAVVLDWRPVDLYGLLYAKLRRTDHTAFDSIVKQAQIPSLNNCPIDKRIELQRPLVEDEDVQWKIFDILAGEFMGSTKKRGRPYTWLMLHLADALNQVSPRTFLTAIMTAANFEPCPESTAIDQHGINEGVRKASENRVDDLKEDYPWAPPALLALARLLVPCNPQEMIDRWQAKGIFSILKEKTPIEKTPAWLADASSNEVRPLEDLLSAMADIGVIEERRTTGKVDVPDIFRLPADIRRKGGVTPQQRKHARIR